MKRGTASRVILGKNTIAEMPGGVFVGTDVFLGKKDGLTNDFNGLVLSNTVMLGKKVSHAAIISVIVRGTDRIVLPDAIANSLSYVKAFGGTYQGMPDGYTRYTSVYNPTNNMKIDTGINLMDTQDDVEYELQIQPNTGSWYIFQSQTPGAGTDINGISGASTGAKIAFGRCGVGVVSEITRVTSHRYYVKGTAKAGTITLYVKDLTDDVEDTVTGTYTPEVMPDTNIYLWGSEKNNAPANNYIEFARLRVAGKLVMDAVPAKDSKDEYGMYDYVRGRFMTPVQSGRYLDSDGSAVVLTPTPDAPVDIVSNNGVLKYSKNLLDMSAENIVLGKYINNTGAVIDDLRNFYNNKYIPVVANGIYTWSTSSSISYFSVMEYDSGYVFKKRTLFSNAGTSGSITLGSDTAFVLVGANMDGTGATLDKIAAVDWQFEKGDSATAYTPYGIYTDGAVETIKDSLNNTATTEMLLKVGNRQDVQSVLDGVVTRNVGIKVLDGTEVWSKSGSRSGLFYSREAFPGATSGMVLCTHLLWSAALVKGRIYNSVGELNFWTDFDNFTLNDWQQWLADQYTAGTPVIVVYPLAEPTTESVTGQTLQVAQGDNTLSIIQASMPGLELEAEYKKQG